MRPRMRILDAPFWVRMALVAQFGQGEICSDLLYPRSAPMKDDKTAHRLAELERENAMLKAAIRACPAGILIASAPDGVIEYWNPAALGIRGAEAENLTNIPLNLHPERWQTFHPNGEVYAPEELPLSRALLKGETVSGDDVIIRDSQGNERWVLGHAAPVYDAQGELLAGVVVFPDISERKKAELEAQRFKQMAELSPDFVAMASRTGESLYVNPAGMALCGLSAETGHAHLTPLDYHSPDARQTIVDVAFPTALRDGVWRGESELLGADGKAIPVSQVLMAHAGSDGEITHLSTVMRDLRPLRELEGQLRQSQRLESMGRLAGGVAHDFNNLLTVIDNYAVLVSDTLPDGDERCDDLQQITTAAERAAGLCQQLLSFARRQIIKPTRLQVDDVVHQLLKMLTRTLGEDIVLTTDMQPDLWPIEVDRSQLDQVIVNLIVNAREAMPDGGELTIEATNVDLDEFYAGAHADVVPGAYVMVAVSDTGTGMSPEVQERVFEPFFTTKDDQGTGLGLSTVHGAVRQNGGHIWLYSEVGEGTCFKIYWPRATGGAQDATGPTVEPAGDCTGTILVVEDEASLRKLSVRLLKSAGFQVLQAADGPEALELAAAYPGDIDLLLTDVIMPHMNGKRLSLQLSHLRPGIRTLYVSGYTENTIVHRGVLEEGVDFLPKPFSKKSLVDYVTKLLTKHN